ncbi:DNA-binding transcriptional regulator, AcrR family [Nocardioides scoriae]|uniref:DNA-binding transcriptional regulator, AcrR family n=1 Tax=Nocardioides scoriae TaxID=642780 RepID=A0A1H1XW63_9ACTN|nr:TetR family transcriptional regulator [Nocardioides scoriae]SDT13477.1 DNA-binding transcriptional regulator, AcrR family [Nocardioides scoriae]
MEPPATAPVSGSARPGGRDVPAQTRGERKERTRRAIMDAALVLCEDSSLVALSLRQVAKEVGIVPTAFYRHFASIEDLGLALVEDSFASLRAMLRDVRRTDPDYTDIIDSSITVLVEHCRSRRAHFAFIARERSAGPPAVRSAILHQIELVERELATDLARLTDPDFWSTEDLGVLANLIVTLLVGTTEAILGARPDAEEVIAERARTQLRMLLVGSLRWRSSEHEESRRHAAVTPMRPGRG